VGSVFEVRPGHRNRGAAAASTARCQARRRPWRRTRAAPCRCTRRTLAGRPHPRRGRSLPRSSSRPPTAPPWPGWSSAAERMWCTRPLPAQHTISGNMAVLAPTSPGRSDQADRESTRDLPSRRAGRGACLMGSSGRVGGWLPPDKTCQVRSPRTRTRLPRSGKSRLRSTSTPCSERHLRRTPVDKAAARQQRTRSREGS
jgi:hypothetical protein